MSKLRLSGLCLMVPVAFGQAAVDCGQLAQDTRVGNAGCLIRRDDAVVLVQQQITGRWALPGGTAEAGERAACTAARETREETGMTVQVQHHLATQDNGFHIFYCIAAESASLEPKDKLEIRRAAWKTAEERRELEWRFPQYQQHTEALIHQLD